jgi:hypothetical protein
LEAVASALNPTIRVSRLLPCLPCCFTRKR